MLWFARQLSYDSVSAQQNERLCL
jgi:hypothetical protein